ncbi:MAG: hypothetical protein WBG92_03510 [Thiohalocapsa sp.]
MVTDFFKHSQRFVERLASMNPPSTMRLLVVYGGDASQRRTQAQVVFWRDLPAVAVGRNAVRNELQDLPK